MQLSPKEFEVVRQGDLYNLLAIHDDLDAAVFGAYGWPVTLSDEEILERLVAMNAERAAEEAGGLVRWLRPEFQNPSGGAATKKTARASSTQAAEPIVKPSKRSWPKDATARAAAVIEVLREESGTASDVAAKFVRATRAAVASLLGTMVVVGLARRAANGRFVACGGRL